MIQGIETVEKLYPDWFDASSELSYDDQKYIWENLPLPQDIDENKNSNTNTNVNSNDNGGCKQQTNEEKSKSKQQIIDDLKKCHHRTPPIELAGMLEVLFSKSKSQEGHWLWIAQHYNPRAINWVISEMLNSHRLGRQVISNPGAYFTFLIKKRKMRHGLQAPMVAVNNKGFRRRNNDK